MIQSLRESTLSPFGLGPVLTFFRDGRLPVTASSLVDEVFGPPTRRGCMVVSGAGGIVGSGKVMQFSARLEPFGVPLVALDVPGAPDGLGRQQPGLAAWFGKERANRIMANVIRLHADGTALPAALHALRPRFLLEAIPENLEIKRAHYRMFRAAYPDIEIRSVTSGFPARELGAGIAHPAFPHAVNKVFETVELAPSPLPRLLWAVGLIPVPVQDHWSFVLDVLFCGLTLAGSALHRATNIPHWKIDKLVRRLLGPNPFRAHDAIGTRGATFLTWSCLHHLAAVYGPLFQPTSEIEQRKDHGASWYPPDHFRPVVQWSLDAAEEEEAQQRLLGPLFQMTALMLHENRAMPACINRIGELCAQFRRGVLAVIRDFGPRRAIRIVEAYHQLEPSAKAAAWHPHALEGMDKPDCAQLYVNAEHDGRIGLITLGRESYNWDVDAELNRAMDWLLAAGVDRVILAHDFHLAAQLVGADTSEFFPALDDQDQGERICLTWSRTARRLHEDFRVSVGFIGGKRCFGGMLELMIHCHFVVAVEGAELGMPEITLPVLPGMEGCHWPFRKCPARRWPELYALLLGGRPVSAETMVGCLIDEAGPLDAALAAAWRLAEGTGGSTETGTDAGLTRGRLAVEALQGVAVDATCLPPVGSPDAEQARQAMAKAIQAACAVPLAEAIAIQARHSANFMAGPLCRRGVIGVERQRIMTV
jgi:enoyl-CoA hydratase/carnithine racemase